MEKKLNIDFAKHISEFERAMKEFKIKRVLYKTLFRGRGLEFDGYRDISEDDDAFSIDWKASLRANKMLARQYIEEKDLNVYFVVDASNSMMFGSEDKLKLEYAAEVIAALTHLVINSGHKAGLVLFTDKATKFIHASRSKNQFPLILSCLSDANLYGGNFDFKGLVEFAISNFSSRDSVIILVSDFIHMKIGFDKPLSLLGTRFETIGLMVRDIFDESLKGAYNQLVLKDPYSEKQILVDPRIAERRYAAFAARQKNLIKKIFLGFGIDLLELKTNASFVIPLVSFLEGRAKGK